MAAGLAWCLLLAGCGDDGYVITWHRPDPAGEEWKLAQAGETLGVKWRLFTTPSDQSLPNDVCTSLEVDPDPDSFENTNPDDLYKGKPVSCGEPLFPWRPIRFVYEHQRLLAAYSLLPAVTDDSVKKVEFVFSDGSREKALPVNGTIVVTYTITKTLESLVLTMADGTLDCTVTWHGSRTARALCFEPEPAPPG